MTQDESRQLDRVRQDLEREFEGVLDRASLEERFAAVVDAFSAAPVRSFVPVLVRRQVRAELRSTLPPV